MNSNEANYHGAQPLNHPAHVPGAASMEPAAISSTDVTAALNAILSVDKFAASPQMSAFLKYVVEQTLLGNTRRIKAFTVGLEALGKSASFDPQTDPSVRVLAKRLRSSLDTYYVQHPDTPIIIEMKPGSYVPKFLIRGQADVQHTGTLTNISVPATSTLTAPAPIAASVTSNHPTHLSISQPAIIGDDSTGTTQEAAEAKPAATDSSETRESGIQRLWKAYKSTPKVAMLVATMSISGWLGVASMTPALNAQASYQDNNPTAEMRLEFASESITQPLRARPTSLTLYTGDERIETDDKVRDLITASLLDRFSQSGQFDVSSEAIPLHIGGYRPGEYRAIFDTLSVNQKVHLIVQIVDPATGHITQAESVVLDQAAIGNELSSDSVDRLESLVAAFEHADSATLQDYRSNQIIAD